MSALNKTESEIWRQYTNSSLLFLSLSPNCYYDHVLFLFFIFQTEPMAFDEIQFWYMKR